MILLLDFYISKLHHNKISNGQLVKKNKKYCHHVEQFTVRCHRAHWKGNVVPCDENLTSLIIKTSQTTVYTNKMQLYNE